MSKKKSRRKSNRRDRRKAKQTNWQREPTKNARKKGHHATVDNRIKPYVKEKKKISYKGKFIEPTDNNSYGFTRKKFSGWMWQFGKTAYLSMIISNNPNRGNFRKLIQNLLNAGYTVKIPSPLGRMLDIVKKNGYTPIKEFSKEYGCDINLWVKGPR